jgi:hypothetical protein
MSAQLQVTGEAKIRDIQGPVVANSGVITALDGAASQYVRGDGTLADFPTSSGGGSSVSYYLNSSVSQGTIGGVAYRELNKEPIIGAGTDIAISTTGYVASYLTDANDPDVLSIPGGNFNCEFYFSVSNDTGNPFFYAELYKYDGTTFTLLGSSVGVPEYINQGTIIAPYYFAIPVPTSALALTDRLAIRIYVNVDGRTVTLHTENGHLCQVVTTLSKGMVSLNNLTDQSQFLTTGTSGTNFAIVSSGDTHTFNLPIASATNTGKLSSTDWSTFNAKQAALSFTAPLVNTSNTISIPAATSLVDGYLDNLDWTNFNTAYNNMIVSAAVTGTTTKTLTLTQQDAGTITASWTDDNTDAVTSVFGRTGAVVAASGDYNTSQVTENTNLYFTDARARAALSFTAGSGAYNSTTGVITIPTDNNQIANGAGYITSSALSAYLPLTGGTLTGALSGTSATFTNTSTFRATGNAYTNGSIILQSSSAATSTYLTNVNGIFYLSNNGSTDHLTIASTGAATFLSSVTASSLIKTGGTSSQFLKADGSVDSSTYLTTSAAASTYLPLAGGTMTGQIVLKESSSSTDFTKGLRFPDNPFGGSGDIAGLRLYNSFSENMVLELYTGNDGAGDVINFATGIGGTANNDSVTINGNKIWNVGNLSSPQSAITLTTTGTSGAATFASNTLNIPQYQAALTNPITGTGTRTINYLPLFSGSTNSIENSSVYEVFSPEENIGVYVANTLKVQNALVVTGNINAAAATLTGALSGTSATFSSSVKITNGSAPTTGDGMELWYNGTSSLIGSYDRSTSTFKQLYLYGSNTIFENGGTERMRITSGGFIKASNNGSYIGVNGAYHEFRNTNTNATDNVAIITVLGSTSNNASNYHYIAVTDGSDKMFVYGNGNIVNTNGSYGTLASDRRLKENIVSATPKLDDIMRLNVVNFNLIGNEDKHIGFIAQEMQEVFPSFVYQNDTRKYDDDGNLISGYEDSLGLKVGMEFAILTKCIQEQQAQIEELKAMILAKN